MNRTEIIFWICIFVSLELCIFYYFTHDINSCSSNPLEYRVKQLKDLYGKDVEITGNIIVKGKTHGWVQPFGDIENKTRYVEDYCPVCDCNYTNPLFFLKV